MTSTIIGEKPHVTCLVVDADTVRYGGSAFRRVKRCRLIETDHEYETSYRCDACKRTVWVDFRGNPRPNYCPACGAEVVR